jgi:hypothetical protein
MLSVVVCDEGVNLSEATGLVAVLGRPCRPFRNLLVQVGSPLSELLEDALGSGLEPFGPTELVLCLLAAATPGEAPVSAETFERFLCGLPFPPGFGEVGCGSLLVSPERGERVKRWTGGSVDDRGESESFGPERVVSAARRRTP